MSENEHYSPAAGAYAQALLELAEPGQQLEAVGQELELIARLIRENQALAIYLKDPAITEEQRAKFLDNVFKGRISPLVLNTLHVVNRKRRSALIGEIAGAYQALLNQKLGRVNVQVTVARQLDDQQLAEVARRVGEALGKQAQVRQSVDESIIGGLILRVEDRMIDASVRSQLRTIRRRLSAKAV